MISTTEIPITEHFDDPLGRLFYDTYDAGQRAALRDQQHIDIRDARIAHENYASSPWIGDQTPASVGGVPTIQFTLTGGGMDQTSTAVGAPLDLDAFMSTDAWDTWWLQVVFQSEDHMDPAESTFTFTSDLGSVDLLASSRHHYDGAYYWPASVLQTLEGPLTQMTLTLGATAVGSGDTRFYAARLVAPDLIVAPLEVDTIAKVIRRPWNYVPGSFPVSTISDPLVPLDFPILLRSDARVGADDPEPIDISEAIIFSPGSADLPGEIRAYFREGSFDDITMLELDNWNGVDGGITMAQLDAAGAQPDYGLARYAGTTQDDLDGLTQDDLDDQPQWAIETKPDYFTKSWMQVRLAWDGTGHANVEIRDTDGNLYPLPEFPMPGIPASDPLRYLLVIALEETSIRVQVLQSTTETMDHDLPPLFDSSLIADSGVLRRRSGRVGWYAHFEGYDAFIQDIIPFSLNYAEYRSNPLRSISPVSGAQVFFGGSPDRQSSLNFIGYGGTIAESTEKPITSGIAYKVTSNGGYNGVRSDYFTLRNAATTALSFDIYVPAASADAQVYVELYRYHHGTANLFTGYKVHQVNVGIVPTETWHRLELPFSELSDTILPGICHMVLRVGDVADTVDYSYYVANMSLVDYSLEWSARATAADPWGDDTTDWLELRKTTNSQTAGVLFGTPGFQLQARCIANRQDAFLTSLKLLPQYAQPGLLIWHDEELPVFSEPSFIPIDLLISGDTVTVRADVTGHTADIALVRWDYGDGQTGYGIESEHTYAVVGSYVVTMTVTFTSGARYSAIAG